MRFGQLELEEVECRCEHEMGAKKGCAQSNDVSGMSVKRDKWDASVNIIYLID